MISETVPLTFVMVNINNVDQPDISVVSVDRIEETRAPIVIVRKRATFERRFRVTIDCACVDGRVVMETGVQRRKTLVGQSSEQTSNVGDVSRAHHETVFATNKNNQKCDQNMSSIVASFFNAKKQ